jgi:hypothetical protein
VTKGFDQVTVVYEGPGIEPTPQPIPPPAPQHGTPVEYTIIHLDHNGDQIGEITPSNLSGSITLNEAGSISYSIPLSSEMSTRGLCDPDLYDWMLVRNGVPLLAGPLESAAPDTDDKEFLPMTGKTWEGYLEERIMPWNPNASNITAQFKVYTNTDVLDIMRSLLDYVLGGANSIPITYDNVDSGVKIDAEFDPSQRSFLLEILQDYASQQPGFDFQIDVDCQLHFWAPSKGVHSDLTLALDVNVESIKYVDNRVKGTRLNLQAGNSGGGNAIRIRNNLDAQSKFRIRDDVVDVGTVQKLGQINNLADDEAALMVQKQRDVTIRARPQGANYWELAGLGDWVFVDGETPYEHLKEWFRITQIEFEVDDNNQEILTYTCSPNTIGS